MSRDHCHFNPKSEVGLLRFGTPATQNFETTCAAETRRIELFYVHSALDGGEHAGCSENPERSSAKPCAYDKRVQYSPMCEDLLHAGGGAPNSSAVALRRKFCGLHTSRSSSCTAEARAASLASSLDCEERVCAEGREETVSANFFERGGARSLFCSGLQNDIHNSQRDI